MYARTCLKKSKTVKKIENRQKNENRKNSFYPGKKNAGIMCWEITLDFRAVRVEVISVGPGHHDHTIERMIRHLKGVIRATKQSLLHTNIYTYGRRHL